MKTALSVLSILFMMLYPGFESGEIVMVPENEPVNHIIEIKQLKFFPDYVEVSKGDTITFINKDFVDHDVTEETNRKWTSGLMKKGTSWKMVASNNVDYFCSLHVIMKGKIRIKKK